VVIGGDAGGMTAATQARRMRRDDLEIVVLEKSEWVSYSACGIPYLVGGDVPEWDDLVVRTPDELRARHIDVRIRNEAMAVDLDRRKVQVRNHEHRRNFEIGFDQLVFATGARPMRPDVPGIDLPHVHGVQTLDDGRRLLARARESECEHVVVVGGGYIGLEMAEAFTKWGASITVVDSAPEVMGVLDPDMGRLVREAMQSHGIDVRCDTSLEAIQEETVVAGGDRIKAELVVLGTGVEARSELARDAGIPTGRKQAIRVDRRQQTEVDGVWAAGDCAESRSRVSGEPIHLPLGTVANKHGRVVGINLGGGYATFPGVVGTAATKLCDTEIACTGLNERAASAAGFVFDSGTIESTTRAGYLSETGTARVKMLAERGTGRVLGAQIVGSDGAAKRIDVVAAALTAGLTAGELVDLDLAYAPPFSPLWDPVQVAARKLT